MRETSVRPRDDLPDDALCVLIVDDEPNIRQELADTLRWQGYDILEASDGNEALRTLNEQNVDLLVVDMFMPYRDGLDTIVEVRKTYPQMKAIAMSGGGRTRHVDFLKYARELGAAAAIRKPFSLEIFRDLVARTLAEGASGLDEEPARFNLPGVVALGRTRGAG